MQHVYGHAENLGNECADHAAALGALGLVTNHNLSTRWTHHSFDSASSFGPSYNLGDVSEKFTGLPTSAEIILGIPGWNYSFTCRLAASSNWRESHFPVISPLKNYVTRRVLMIPRNALAGTIPDGNLF